ncbi:hypothetical protein F2P81_007525 [Scophthalmus maximus]|uniref:Uncharacterized protein n=1 Tax=Scophthalmus maximus TaxID=52904 RepID=A0A6A4T5M0_SCOMX|nr:hypothetical protein F2P81_007525 [Scophthalmus maximus]
MMRLSDLLRRSELVVIDFVEKARVNDSFNCRKKLNLLCYEKTLTSSIYQNVFQSPDFGIIYWYSDVCVYFFKSSAERCGGFGQSFCYERCSGTGPKCKTPHRINDNVI